MVVRSELLLLLLPSRLLTFSSAFVMLDGSLPSGKYQAFSKLKKKQGRVEDSIPHPPKSESISVPFKAESISVPFKAEIISVPFKAESISHPLKANTGVSHQVAKDFLSLTLPGEISPLDYHKPQLVLLTNTYIYIHR